MNVSHKNLLLSLLTASVLGYTCAGLAEGEVTTVAQEPPATTTPVTKSSPTVAVDQNPAVEAIQQVEGKGENPNQQAPADGDKQADATSAIGVTKIPVTGAFGITLGESFAPWMVEKVISQKENKYTSRGEEKTELTGTVYEVTPNIPNPHFNEYSVKVNKDGLIYAIEAREIPAEKTSACQMTKQIGRYLENKYGAPRGKGMSGLPSVNRSPDLIKASAFTLSAAGMAAMRSFTVTMAP